MSYNEIDVTSETRLGLRNSFHRQPLDQQWWKSIPVRQCLTRSQGPGRDTVPPTNVPDRMMVDQRRRRKELIATAGRPSPLVSIHSMRITVAEPVTACYSAHVGIKLQNNYYARRLSLAQLPATKGRCRAHLFPRVMQGSNSGKLPLMGRVLTCSGGMAEQTVFRSLLSGLLSIYEDAAARYCYEIMPKVAAKEQWNGEMMNIASLKKQSIELARD